MASFPEYKNAYENNWAELEIRPSRLQEARNQANRLLHGKPAYQQIESKTGVPWWFVGLCHYRESNFNFDTYLGNGQSLARVTTIVPKGRGPFTGPDAFANGALDALRLEGFIGANDWGIARALYRLEGFNGYGYHGKGVNSPYLYGGSTVYGPPEAKGGKYVADHVFNAGVVDTQLGTAVILKALMQLDSSIDLGGAATDGSSDHTVAHDPDDELAKGIVWLQRSLNKLGANPPLAEDGKNGPKTMEAVSHFQRENSLPDTGLADAATIAAIGQKLSSPPPPPPKGQPDGQVPGDLIVAIKQLLDQLQKGGGVQIPVLPAPANDLTSTLQQVANLLQKLNINIPPTSTTPISMPPPPIRPLNCRRSSISSVASSTRAANRRRWARSMARSAKQSAICSMAIRPRLVSSAAC